MSLTLRFRRTLWIGQSNDKGTVISSRGESQMAAYKSPGKRQIMSFPEMAGTFNKTAIATRCVYVCVCVWESFFFKFMSQHL